MPSKFLKAIYNRKGLFIRAKRITDTHSSNSKLKHLKLSIEKNGYNTKDINQVFYKHETHIQTNKKNSDDSTNNKNVCIPYWKGF